MCLFCQIIAGEIPSYKVYEDENIFVILDIEPVNPGHILVLTKKHAATIEDVSEEDLTAVILGVKKMGGYLKEKLGYESYNIHQNNGLIAGQTVAHLHFHLIPRLESDGLKHWPAHDYAPGEAEKIVTKLKS